MHCASCEVLIERKWKKIPGVHKVSVNHATGRAEVFAEREPSLDALQQPIQEKGYTVTPQSNDDGQAIHHRATTRDYKEIGIVFFVIVSLYLILKRLDVLPEVGVTENMGYGLVFLIGLVAALSTCIAVTGGLLMAVAAKYNERNPNLTGAQRLRPHLYFNIGRIVSYTVLGGAIGGLGSVITLSTKTTGFVMIIASLVMIILGFQLLKLFPGLKRFQPKMPKFIAHKIHDWSNADNKAAPFFLGGSTFFLPCGFTQALQLYVLSQGDVTTGALTMFFFSLGTLPALMSLSAISSFARGSFQRYFMKFAGVLVILLGFSNISNGLALTGNSISFSGDEEVKGTTSEIASDDPNVVLEDGKQIVEMTVNGLSYSPSRFRVKQGIPVEWRIDGRRSQGCAQVVTVPKLGLTKFLSGQQVTTVTFTPEEAGTLEFSCSMGMTTRGAAFIVEPNDDVPDSAPANPKAPTPTPSPTPTPQGCDPTVQQCITAQKISMEVTREKGFYPNSFTVKKDVPVELTVDTKVKLGGCMGTMVIPDYDVAERLPLGKTTLAFTPTETGSVVVTCSMGSPLAEISVIN